MQRPLLNTIDGVSIDRFELGREYEMGNQVAAVFLAEGWGVPATRGGPPPIVPFGPNDPYDPRALYRRRVYTAKTRDHGSDSKRRGGRKKKN